MPSRSAKQARYFAMLAHDPAKARAAGVPLKTAKEWNKADQKTGILKGKKQAN